MCHWIETFPLIFAFKGIYNLMITIPLPPKSVLVIEQCHHWVPVGRGDDSLVWDARSTSETCLMLWLLAKSCVRWGFPAMVTRTFALGKMFKNKVG